MSPRIKRKMIAGAVAMGFMEKGAERFDDFAIRSAILKRWALSGGIADFARYFNVKPAVAARYLKGAGVKEPENKKPQPKTYKPRGRNVRVVNFKW